jgi:hypothetical protein
MAMTEEEFVRKARNLYRQANEEEKERIARDKNYFHDWIQALIGWIAAIWGWICSCCFLTTAVCSQRGRGNKCDELQTLRRFRDEYLLGSGDSSRIADVEEYYRIAPGVYLWIQGRPDSEAVWNHLNLVVDEAVRFIKLDRHHEAYQLYKRHVLELIPCLAPRKMR